MIKVGIIGVGRWGINYFRTFDEIDNVEVKWICSKSQETIKKALNGVTPKSKVNTTVDYNKILNDKNVDAVAIASPASTHYKFAKEALNNGKHILVEKPVVLRAKEVQELIDISEKREKIFMVGHIYLYNPSIKKIKSDLEKDIFGKINFINISHFGNGPIRKDINALWDFFPHSVSILLYLLKEYPLSVSANGAPYINKNIEDVAAMTIRFPNNIFAISTASWLYPLKKMEVVFAGEKMCAVFNDYAKEEKLKYYKPLSQEYFVPKIGNERPLTAQLKHFLDCVESNKKPLTNGEEALKVTKVLEAAQKSLENNGKKIEI